MTLLSCGQVVRSNDGGVHDGGQSHQEDSGEQMDGATSKLDASSADTGPQPRLVTLTVVVDGAGSGFIEASASGLRCPQQCRAEIEAGARVTLTSSAAASSAFAGWSAPGCGTARDCVVTVSQDTTITGSFDLRTMRVTAAAAGDGVGALESVPAGIACGTDCEHLWPFGTSVSIDAIADPGSEFTRWLGGPCADSLLPRCSFDVLDGTAVTAEFARTTNTLNVGIAGAGAGAVTSIDTRISCGLAGQAQCTASYRSDEVARLTASPNPASTFAGWSGDCTGSTTCELQMTRDRSVQATFAPILHSLRIRRSGPGLGSVTDSGGTIDCGATCEADFLIGSSVTLIAAPQTNYRFLGWSGACVGVSDTCTLTIASDSQVTALFEFVPRLRVGFWHACATSAAGELRCWGDNSEGQLGYGSTQDIGDDELPASVGNVSIPIGVEDVALGFAHTCAIVSGGSVRCWGNGGGGRLGLGDSISRGDSPTTIPSALPNVMLPGPATKVVAGFAHTCALLTTGALYCWGSNEFGQIGYAGTVTAIGSAPNSLPAIAGPVPVGGVVADVAAGNRMTCVRLTGGDVRCFGDAELGQLGYGNRIDIGVGQNNTPAAQPPVDVGGPVEELYLATGAHICARVSTGQVRCWGSGFEGRLGYGNTNNVGDATTPASHPALTLPGVPLTLHAGGAHTCALFGPNDVRCWGRNQEGQLGLGDTEIRGDSIAEQPASLPSVATGGPVIQVASGGFFSCARFADLTIACWGDNTKGQLGFGDMLPRGHSGATVPSLNGRSSVF